MLIVNILVQRHIRDVTVELVFNFFKVRRLVLILLTVTFAEGVFLGCRVSILAHGDANQNEDEDESVESAEHAKDHVRVRGEEHLAELQVDDATEAREGDNEGHDDASNHFGDAFDRIALHGDNNHEARATLERRQKVCVPTGWVLAKHVGSHDEDLEAEDCRHEDLWRHFVGEAGNQEDLWQGERV